MKLQSTTLYWNSMTCFMVDQIIPHKQERESKNMWWVLKNILKNLLYHQRIIYNICMNVKNSIGRKFSTRLKRRELKFDDYKRSNDSSIFIILSPLSVTTSFLELGHSSMVNAHSSNPDKSCLHIF
jgi:hypothetical protein